MAYALLFQAVLAVKLPLPEFTIIALHWVTMTSNIQNAMSF